MGRKSSIEELAPEIVEAVHEAIRRKATIDEIVAAIGAMGGEASRSAVGRYKKSFEDVGRKMREAREIAAVWVDKLGKEPEGDVGRLVGEMIRTLAFRASMDAAEAEVALPAEDVMLLAKAMQHLASADKLNAELVLKLRKELGQKAAAAAADAAGAAAREAGAPLGSEALKRIREQVYGIFEAPK